MNNVKEELYEIMRRWLENYVLDKYNM